MKIKDNASILNSMPRWNEIVAKTDNPEEFGAWLCCIVKGVKFKKCLVLTGDRNVGKSTLLRAIADVVFSTTCFTFNLFGNYEQYDFVIASKESIEPLTPYICADEIAVSKSDEIPLGVPNSTNWACEMPLPKIDDDQMCFAVKLMHPICEEGVALESTRAHLRRELMDAIKAAQGVGTIFQPKTKPKTLPKTLSKTLSALKGKHIESAKVRKGVIYLTTEEGACILIEGSIKKEATLKEKVALGILSQDDLSVLRRAGAL